MAKNNANIKNREESVVDKVLKIIGKKESDFSKLGDDYRADISTILKESENARENKQLALYLVSELGAHYFHEFKKLQSDPDLITAALKQDSEIFSRLSVKDQLNIKFAKLAIESLVREKTNFVEIEKFLTKYFPGGKVFSQLFSFYKKYLKIAEYVFYSDVERQLITIREKNPTLYNTLFQKKLLEQQGNKIALGEKFSEFFLGQISQNPQYDSLSDEEKNAFKLKIFINFLGLNPTDVNEDLTLFFTSLSDLIHVKKDTKKIEETIEEDDELELDNDDEDEEFGVEDRLDFCIPQCNYSLSSSGTCDIQLSGVKIQFSQEELSRINDTALKNYISALSLLDDLGLRFALQHKDTLFSICEVKPFDGDGLSDGKVLKILNKIAKKIGIPEKEIITGINEEGEQTTEKKVGCFERLDEAKFRFRAIKSSGYINDEFVFNPADTGNKSIVQRKLIQKGLFDDQGGGFSNIQSWRS